MSTVIADRVRKWLRARKDKRAGEFYEGPEPPRRIHDQVLAFANAFPGATRAQWTAAMVDLAEGFWRDAWIRSQEWTDRAPDAFGESPMTVEEFADALDAEWRSSPAVELARPGDLVQDVREDEDVQRDYLAALRRRTTP